ncbi:hypothetical protein FD763_18025 [Klebsiella quasipneumoniae]|uniref:hypothetical protein n=1 Tax=Klebsiella quasipneumoniae TaxID=1463165 RepID=UPI001BA6B6AA|nr:hypothetical protein [Klebsiella quasipneumoniae]MBQ5276578.1 hypothetical protein [Klebsiella quasipneumoniae]
MNISTVNELIQSLESAGELSIKETKVMELAKAYQQLAAENVALKALIPENWQMHDVLHQLIVARPGGVYFNKWEKLIIGVLNETHATDRIVAGIKADGVEEFVSNTVHKIFDGSEAVSALAYLSLANSHVKLLREGADK